MKILLFALPILSGVIVHVEAASCSGASQDGYCCNGSILKKDHSDDLSASNLICCQGDPHLQINFGSDAPTSCTAGTEIPLTQASSDGSSQSTAASGSSSQSAATSVASSSTNDAVRAMITTAPLMGAAAVAGGLLLGL